MYCTVLSVIRHCRRNTRAAHTLSTLFDTKDDDKALLNYPEIKGMLQVKRRAIQPRMKAHGGVYLHCPIPLHLIDTVTAPSDHRSNVQDPICY
jgi:hypothetical protein